MSKLSSEKSSVHGPQGFVLADGDGDSDGDGDALSLGDSLSLCEGLKLGVPDGQGV